LADGAADGINAAGARAAAAVYRGPVNGVLRVYRRCGEHRAEQTSKRVGNCFHIKDHLIFQNSATAKIVWLASPQLKLCKKPRPSPALASVHHCCTLRVVVAASVNWPSICERSSDPPVLLSL